MRGWLLSHFLAVLFGALVAVFWFWGEEPAAPDRGEIHQLEAQVQELKARLLSHEEVKKRFDERIARLLLTKASAPKPEDVEVPAPSIDESVTSSGVSTDRVEVSLAFDEAVALANYRGMATEVFGLIRAGEFDVALETIQYLEWLVNANDDLNPLGEIQPLYREATGQWAAHLMSALLTEPDMMLRFALDLRQRRRDGVEIGELAQFLCHGDVAMLALSGGSPIDLATGRAWLEEMDNQLQNGGHLPDSEIAGLAHISGPQTVKVLKMAWESGKNRDEVICALVQVNSPESRRLLQQLVFEIHDRPFRAALEAWLGR